ncbi:flavin-containing amine oxidoreductase-domain containing protein [Aspergillus tamarii]|uniref:Flavin-containing amine oxidoreductase-domain containing protein n=1 Tax=Aspergillus tamarii TaxID=41984 RepID=A0A5N6V3X3_ASPTM|nr:flavin-containing amine oxidoreductase-domain containing protein [Aspergillus tamarii]
MAPTFHRYTSGLLALGLFQVGWAGVVHKQTELVRFRVPDVTADSLHNVYIEFPDSGFQGEIHLLYGDCEISSSSQRHHEIGTIYVKRDAHPERFVWATPVDAPHLHCLHAFSGATLVGRSAPVSVTAPLVRRESIADVADAMGPWFDGVAYMQAKEPGKAVVTQAKDASVAIIGGGMSGLMTSLLLGSVGMHNWHIIESSGRIGGRIRTEYLNHTRPDQYQYQEMGPMRFPVSITYADTNETLEIQDHKMVFQLSDVLNEMNTDHPELAVNFIPFVQNSPNVPASSGGYRLPNGLIPTAADVAANSSLVYEAASSNATEAEDAAQAYTDYTTADKISRKIITDMYQAHKSAVESGYFHWSEAGYLRYALGYNDNITDYVAGSDDTPMWDSLYEGVYFSATKWRTIDKGLESLPRAFWPHVANKTTLNRKIQGLSFNETTGKIAVNWRDDPMQLEPESADYDYAVVSAPFSKVRLWDMPRYSSLLSRAISTMNYAQSCKMSLHFKTRFWEHQEKPIFGGCGSVDLPGIGSVCYPSFNINGTGPGVVLASYVSDTPARSIAALSTEDHVALVLRSMVQIHGSIAAEQYTGIYDRQCWEVDEHQAGAWAAPLVGQQELYLPAYYQTEFKTIFIGEHTSYTHAWIFSALDSAVRGTTQLLLDLGLVDEAKAIVNTWMGRWIKV